MKVKFMALLSVELAMATVTQDGYALQYSIM
jgi:hypothetical protein